MEKGGEGNGGGGGGRFCVWLFLFCFFSWHMGIFSGVVCRSFSFFRFSVLLLCLALLLVCVLFCFAARSCNI